MNEEGDQQKNRQPRGVEECHEPPARDEAPHVAQVVEGLAQTALPAQALGKGGVEELGPHVQVHRCTGADGSTTFTDKRCRDVNAVEASPTPAAPGAVAKGLRAARCR